MFFTQTPKHPSSDGPRRIFWPRFSCAKDAVPGHKWEGGGETAANVGRGGGGGPPTVVHIVTSFLSREVRLFGSRKLRTLAFGIDITFPHKKLNRKKTPPEKRGPEKLSLQRYFFSTILNIRLCSLGGAAVFFEGQPRVYGTNTTQRMSQSSAFGGCKALPQEALVAEWCGVPKIVALCELGTNETLCELGTNRWHGKGKVFVLSRQVEAPFHFLDRKVRPFNNEFDLSRKRRTSSFLRHFPTNN